MSATERLIRAIEAGDAGRIRAALKAGAPLDDLLQYRSKKEPEVGRTLRITPLDLAGYVRQSPAAQALVSAGAKPDHPHSEYPIIFAATHYASLGDLTDEDDWYDVIRKLQASNADMNRRFPQNMETPLMRATKARVASLLLDGGASVNDSDAEGRTALMHLMRYWQVAAELVSRGANTRVKDKSGRSILHYACYYAKTGSEAFPDWHSQLAKNIIEAGEDIQAPDSLGRTPLMESCSSGSTFALLLERGARADPVDKHGQGAIIHLCRRRGMPAAQAVKFVQDLIAAGQDPLARDAWNRDALFYAVITRPQSTALIELLLDQEPDATLVDNLRRTVLMYAARSRLRIDLLVRLIDMGADMARKDVDGRDVWHHAILYPLEKKYIADYEYGDVTEDPLRTDYFLLREPAPSIDHIRTLLSASGGFPALDDKDLYSNTPLQLLVMRANNRYPPGSFNFTADDYDVSRTLLANLANPSSINEDGISPVMAICEYADHADPTRPNFGLQALEALISQGADINARDFKGRTALSIAERRGARRKAQLLRRYGATSPLSSDDDSEDGITTLEDVADWLALSIPLDNGTDPDEAQTESADESDSDEALEGELREWRAFFTALWADYAAGSSNKYIGDPQVAEQESSGGQPIGGGGESPLAATLHPAAAKLYRDANTLYQADAHRQFPHISINSGTRTVQEQVRLYRAFIEYKECDGPHVPGADQPGASWHNIGVAVDVIRGNDEPRIRDALVACGWVQRVADEGWHFEAHGIPNWQLIEQKVAQQIAPAARDLANTIVDFVLFGCYLRRNEAKFLQDKADVQKMTREVALEKQALDRAKTELRQRTRAVQQAEIDQRKEAQHIADLRRTYHGMVYDLCPNKKPYPECDHNDLKDKWNRQRKDLLAQIERRSSALVVAQRKTAEEKRLLVLEGQKIRKQEREYSKRYQELSRAKKALQDLERKMQMWRRKRTEAEIRIQSDSVIVQQLVDGLRSTP